MPGLGPAQGLQQQLSGIAHDILPSSLEDQVAFELPELDIDAITQSFILEQQMVQQSLFPQQLLSPWDLTGDIGTNEQLLVAPVQSVTH